MSSETDTRDDGTQRGEVSNYQESKNLETYFKSKMARAKAEHSIWEFCDSKPWFIAGLSRNNPSIPRQALESMMYDRTGTRISRFESSTHSFMQDAMTEGTASCSKSTYLAQRQGGKNIFTRSTFEDPTEVTTVISKTRQLIRDMEKSTEFVYHGLRACARFLTYPTPSIPSDNHCFGQAKGWLWIIFKGIQHLRLPDNPGNKSEISSALTSDLTELAKKVLVCRQELGVFTETLKHLQECVDKEAKKLKSKSLLWEDRMTSYKLFRRSFIKRRDSVLIDLSEDRVFPSDWFFDPKPSETKFEWDFFHIQWVKGKTRKEWQFTEFELRSDYSLKWFTFSSFPREHQLGMIRHFIFHLTAMYDECIQFNRNIMRVNFGEAEIKVLHDAVLKVTDLKKNSDIVSAISQMTKKFFEDLTLVHECCKEFHSGLLGMLKLLMPLFSYVRGRKPRLSDDSFRNSRKAIQAEISVHSKKSCQTCGRTRKSFLKLYGEPMNTMMMRTPISMATLVDYFPLSDRFDGILLRIPLAHEINKFGVSEGYSSSIFDNLIGRAAPKLPPKFLPRTRRSKTGVKDFDIDTLLKSCKSIMRTEVGTTIHLDQYSLMMRQILNLLLLYPTIFTFMAVDFKDKLDLFDDMICWGRNYYSLQTMMNHEYAQYIHMKDSRPEMATKRYAFKLFIKLIKYHSFAVRFFEHLIKLDMSESTSSAGKQAFAKVLTSEWSWFYNKRANFNLSYMPEKKEFYAFAFPGYSPDVVDKMLNDFINYSLEMLDIIENVLSEYDLLD